LPHDVQQQVSFKLTNQDLDDAFRRNEFQLVYQPQIATKGAHIEGAEAFARWNHPIHGVIPPSLFLHFVESQGRSRELTNYLLRQAVPTATAWAQASLNWKLTINVGLADIVDGTLPLTIDILLREFDLQASQLTIDVPETDLALEWDRKWPNIAPTLRSIRELGSSVALDCSGPDTLKIDQIDPETFDILKVGGGALLKFTNGTKALPFGFISSRLEFAKRYGLKTIAVGVEDNAMLLTLKKMGFDSLQGYMICKPVSLEELSNFRRTFVAPSLFFEAGEENDGAAYAATPESELAQKTVSAESKVLEATWSDVQDGDLGSDEEAVLLRRKPTKETTQSLFSDIQDDPTPVQNHTMDWLRSTKRRLFSD